MVLYFLQFPPVLHAWFLTHNRLDLVHVNLNSGIKIAKPCALAGMPCDVILWWNSNIVAFSYKYEEPIKNK